MAAAEINTDNFVSTQVHHRDSHEDFNGEGSAATSPNTTLQRKRPLSNLSVHETDGNSVLKRFIIVSQKEEYKWSLPPYVAEYAKANSEKFITDKDLKEAILLILPRRIQ